VATEAEDGTMGTATQIVEEILQESLESLRKEEEAGAPVEAAAAYKERRKHARQGSDFTVHFRILLEDGQVFNRGTATLTDVGPGGALLTGFSCARDAFPARSFTMAFKILSGEFEGVEAVCTPVRFSYSPSFGIGVRFESLSVRV
jgi:hypothetical protein